MDFDLVLPLLSPGVLCGGKEAKEPKEASKDGAEGSVEKYGGKWQVDAAVRNHRRGDLCLVLKTKARHHTIAAKLKKPYLFEHKPFMLQYEVQFLEEQNCGGAYVKLLCDMKDNGDLGLFDDNFPYTFMFGPDKCGRGHKLHLIFPHGNPRNKSYEEKHWEKSGDVSKLN
ncbi:calnexin, putative [Ixodes scapularis]|uniref:Calnexin, putative n=1 Tax=Ixodes scapularis TaxID=6945 RepID=B7PCE9_IXOSC|nr:calnexin, putative [Ixodes scapularis]|eukprot:XP_002409759.1 calnexin, putative [Ixodes scapularis]